MLYKNKKMVIEEHLFYYLSNVGNILSECRMWLSKENDVERPLEKNHCVGCFESWLFWGINWW